MSSIYNLEPQPTASVIIHTTLGDLSVELFAKQTPLTCRNFLQLALDGYYDNTIFHRLVRGFILQGGDPTGTGNGGESIYDGGALSGDLDPWPMDERRGKNAGPSGINFKDEFHSRLKFNRRGLLGMANEGVPDSNGSQFFFTLDKADELNGKNTVFGRIAGDTIYNLMKMGEAELEEGSERPLYSIKITQIEVLINPFEGMKKRERQRQGAEQVDQKSAAPDKRKKRLGGKKLLSFADDDGDMADSSPPLKKAKFDTRIVMDEENEQSLERKSAKPKKKKEEKKVPQTGPSAEPEDSPRKTEASIGSAEMGIVKPEEEDGISPEPDAPPTKSLLDRTNEEIAAVKASMRRNMHAQPAQKEKPKSALEQMIPTTSTRGRKRRQGGNNTTPQQDQRSLDLLRAFKSKLEHGPPEKQAAPESAAENGRSADGQENEEEVCDLHFIANCQSCQSWDKREAKENDDDEGWMSHSLSFAADKLGKDLSYRKKAEEELIVIDPREKAKNLREEKKAERESRSGGSGRAWDQERNAQIARASALAGRGAR